MKAYFIHTEKGLVATESNNKTNAFEKVKKALPLTKVFKTGIMVSKTPFDQLQSTCLKIN